MVKVISESRVYLEPPVNELAGLVNHGPPVLVGSHDCDEPVAFSGDLGRVLRGLPNEDLKPPDHLLGLDLGPLRANRLRISHLSPAPPGRRGAHASVTTASGFALRTFSTATLMAVAGSVVSTSTSHVKVTSNFDIASVPQSMPDLVVVLSLLISPWLLRRPGWCDVSHQGQQWSAQ